MIAGHAGVLRRIGWAKDDDGNDVFRAVVDYPNGPPGDDLPFDAVWKSLPVKIVVQDLAHAKTQSEQGGAP